MKRASAQLAETVGKVVALEEALGAMQTEVATLRNATPGNIVLVRRNGFSRPMFISPTYGCRGPELPQYVEMPEFNFRPTFVREQDCPSSLKIQTTRFRDTGSADAFGRRLFEEI